MNFNIHDLLYLTIEGKNKRYLDYLGKEYSFCKTAESIIPDIEIVITDSVNPDGDCHLIDNKYFIKDGYLYCQDRYKVARWSLAINDLEGKTVVHFSGGFWGEHILRYFIIKPLIGFKLVGKGFSILHASAIGINDAAFVFAGGPGTRKTTSILNLNTDSNTFLADETTILSNDGVIYGFPSPLPIFYYNLEDMTFPYQGMTLRQRTEMKIKHLVYVLSLGYAKLPLSLPAEQLFQRTNGVYPLRCLVLLTTTEGNNIAVTEIADKKELVERLVRLNEQQFPYWFKYASAYSSVYPSGQLASYLPAMRANLSQALEKVTCYEIKAPGEFSAHHRVEFQQVLQTLARVN